MTCSWPRRRQALTRLTASAAGGVATAGVYVALGLLLAAGTVPVAVAGTAVLAIRSAQASLASLLYAVNQCYEEGLYFSDYLDFIADASGRVPPAGGTPAPASFGQISAEEVTFSYPGADEPALREVSVTIRRGEVVALVGENGSGKTTLAKVLAGLYLPQVGTVRWDQTPIADMDLTGLRERIAVIAQDHANWPLTARSNITMGRPADAARLAEAVSLSGADTVIDGLPRGLDTLLDRQFVGGAELSGGQWQRVAVARGFYRAAPLLIMDEPTAALDARAEYALFASVRQKIPGRSILLITHRLASVRHCDRIYVLDGGRIVEQGRHAELVALGGQYAELYALQASQYEPPVPAPRTPSASPAARVRTSRAQPPESSFRAARYRDMRSVKCQDCRLSKASCRRSGPLPAGALDEPDQADQPGGQAVDSERGQRPGAEVPGQEDDRRTTTWPRRPRCRR